MLCLKAASSDDTVKENHFLRDMPLDENGLTNAWSGLSYECFKEKALPEMIAFRKAKTFRKDLFPRHSIIFGTMT